MITHKSFYSVAVHALAIGFLLTTGVNAAPPEVQTAEFDGILQERHDAEVNVSGNVIVGLMSAGAHVGMQDNNLLLQAGEFKDSKTTCLRVTSRDGTYHSSNPYILNGGKAAVPTRIPYPSKYPLVIKKFTKNDVGITVTVGECDKNPRHYLIPSAQTDLLLGDAENYRSTPGTILVLVNGFDATDVSFAIKEPEGYYEKGDCAYIEDGRHTAFNYICELTEVPDAVTELSLSLFREVYGRSLPEITVDISMLN